MEEIIIKKINGTILIELNRERVLNALNLSMVRNIKNNIKSWENDKEISGVIIKGAGEKAFCAGGDIVSVYHAKNDINNDLSDLFFREEFLLNIAIKNFTKPWISLLNGISMGGGLGLSVHGSHRLVTNKTIAAMPETAIGYFPDVGGGYFLSRMPHSLGPYLALTGNTLGEDDCLFSGIATHKVENNNIEEIEAKVLDLKSYDKLNVEEILKDYTLEREISSLEKNRDLIEKHFSNSKLIDVFKSLKNDENEWTNKTLQILLKKSPTSMGVALRQLEIVKNLSFEECMVIEFRICQAMMSRNDFYEGVRANLVDKDRNPKWSPTEIIEINDKMIEDHFTPLGNKDLIN